MTFIKLLIRKLLNKQISNIYDKRFDNYDNTPKGVFWNNKLSQDLRLNIILDKILKITNGKLYAVFNNGAFALPGALEDIPSDGMKEIFQTNFFGWHYLTRKIIPVMRKQGYGRIIQCSFTRDPCGRQC